MPKQSDDREQGQILVLFALTTCGGDHLSSVTAPPKNISCDAAFNGTWSWILQTCGGFANGSAPAQLSTANGCRLTLDTTPADLKAKGQSFTLIVAFDTHGERSLRCTGRRRPASSSTNSYSRWPLRS